MRLGENALYRLATAPVVVRIARTVDYWNTVTKEVQVARWLADQGFPAAEVTGPAHQPLAIDGHPVTFWRFIHGRVAMPEDVAELGHVLRRFHELPTPKSFALPGTDIMARIEPRVAKAPVPAEDKRMLLDRCEELRGRLADLQFPLAPTAVHGDAHIKNLMMIEEDPVLLDFENTAHGQPEWDLAVTATEYATGGWWTAEQYGAFVDAYGYDVREWHGFNTLRATHEIKMTTWIMQNVDHSADVAAEYRARILTLRTGEIHTGWNPH
jgi:Ser/Thr protein kinase RdoA (MazF antagonist)